MSSNDTAAYVASLMAINKTTLPADGGERFNRLIFAKSPYLLQHAENPVKWYEWGQAAFDLARTESLPILLSIGYATCHWCHVMAHESFEDNEVATLLNRHFVCIKVDREERPDIDDFYMAVAQTLTGSGGWPLNIFMTPEKHPFMTITYLPKRGRGEMSGLMELLANIATLWRQRPDMIERNCHGIMEALEGARNRHGSEIPLNISANIEKSLQQLKKIYDSKNGGFGKSPKFPMPVYLSWLTGQKKHRPIPHPAQTNGTNTGETLHHPTTPTVGEDALQMALHTLRKMRSGGIWDQLGGGLHRYSVDSVWMAPHFEKMLYDQAMLAQVTIEAYLATGDQFYRTMTEEIFSFVERELKSSEGAFCSALDADSEGVEGKFYVWNKSEIDDCLGIDSGVFCLYHNVTDEGNFDGQTILTASDEHVEFCRVHGLDDEGVKELLVRCRTSLLELRETRIRPLRDDKIITSWNGLMISALATAGIVYSNPEYIASASMVTSFILKSLRRADGRLLRSYLNGASDVPAFLEDYAFLTAGLLDLYEATLNQIWLNEARTLVEELLQLFRNPESGEYTLTGHDAEQMPARVLSDHDGVTPSALSRTANVLYRLAWIDNKPELLEYARKTLSGIMGEIRENTLGHLGALHVLTLLETEPTTAIFTGKIDSIEALMLNVALHNYSIKNLIIRSEERSCPLSLSICIPGTCYPAVSNEEELNHLLSAT